MKTKRFASLAMILVSVSGCSLYSDPFRDEFANQPPITTPSVDAVMAAEVAPIVIERHGEPKTVYVVDGSVHHYPLYFEDPKEDHGSEDGQFKVTGEDYLWIAAWRARFLANLVAFPVSAVVNPPWQPMVSDGRYECCGRGATFDAVPCCR